MSWIVGEYIRQMPYIKEQADINSSTFNNVLFIERAIQNMEKEGLLTERELNILSAVSYGYSYSEIARLLGLHRLTVSAIFKATTDRISYILGGDFTDTAFIEKIKTIDPTVSNNISKLFRQGAVKKKDG